MIAVAHILKLSKQLFPTGRAWKIPVNSVFEKLLKGLAASEVRAYNYAITVLYKILPDNANFTSNDATLWERRLGLPIQSGSLNLETRKSIILRKYQYPGRFLNRQNYRYLEAQLQLAGFAISITENTNPAMLIGTVFSHSFDTEHGFHTEMGAIDVDLIANSAERGEVFDVQTALDVFIINGIIPPALLTTFRKLVLSLKPVNTVAILNITYTTTGDLALISGANLYAVNGSNIVLTNYSGSDD